MCIEARIHPPYVAFENLISILAAQVRAGVEIFLSVVEIFACCRVASLDGAYHLGAEENVVNRNDTSHEFDARLMIHTGIERNVVEYGFEGPLPQAKGEAPVLAP